MKCLVDTSLLLRGVPLTPYHEITVVNPQTIPEEEIK